MRALVFGTRPEAWEPPPGAPDLVRNLAATPCALLDVPDARPLRPDWVVIRPRLTGICGSDAKQVLLDFEGDGDSALSGLCSFPQVLGHEVVAEVVELGPEAEGVEVGQRVVLNPWLSCVPRGVRPLCPACTAGDLSLCWSFTVGPIATGIHSGTSRDAGGGYAELMPAHPAMLFPVPDGVDDEHAMLADPFAVSLHGVTRHPPPPGGRALVWGAGALGACALAVLRALHPDVEVGVVARFDAQAALAERLGAHAVFRLGTQAELVERLAAWSGGVLRPTMEGLDGLPMCHPGGVDVVYDTVGRPETLEVAVRVLKARGTLVQSGVHPPGRWEWSPLYFKEIALVGSNAFGLEDVGGVRRHGIEHYLDLAAAGRVDLAGLHTHTFGLSAWRDAFLALADQETSGAIKVALDPGPVTAAMPETPETDRPIAFVCAMPMELRPLTKRLGLRRAEIGGAPARTGTLDGRPVVGVVTGMGTRPAAAGVERLLDAVTPAHVLVVGITGAVDDETPIGTLVLPERVVDHRTGREHAHHVLGPGAVHGTLWTTDGITPAADLPDLRARGVVALDMETAAIALACEERGVPWSVFRAISDRATDGSVDDEVFGMSRQDGTPNPAAVARYLVRHPARIPGLVRLARGATLAANRAADAAVAAVRAG